jgi:hypothetical protein
MAEGKQNKTDPTKIAVALGVLCIVLALIVVLMGANVVPTFNSNKAARLINVGMGAQDIPSSHILRISGYVTNVGLDPAYHAQIHVTAVYTQGGEAIDTWVNVGNGGIIYGGDSVRVVTDVGYSSDGLGSWTITPAWANAP